jgi:hypothetical protein
MSNIANTFEKNKQLIQSSRKMIDSSKQSIKSSREILESFYKTFRNFQKMSVGENFITYKVPTTNQVAGAVEKAEKLIAEKNLPLQVVGGKYPLKHFIVKTI